MSSRSEPPREAQLNNKANAPAQIFGNAPVWDPLTANAGPKARQTFAKAFQESWYLKINDPVEQRALWIRFTLHVSNNGFKRIAETWAVFFQRDPGTQEIQKTAVRQTYDLSALAPLENGLKLGEAELTDSRCRGQAQSRGNSVQWDLSFTPREPLQYDLVPSPLRKTRILRNSMLTVNGDLVITGTTVINGKTYRWDRCFGMQGHQSGSKSPHSWVWGHCNVFQTEQGQPTPFVFEGLSARGRLIAGLPSPRFSSFAFFYQGKSYFFHSLRDAMSLKSRHTMNEWTFQADRGEVSFRGQARADHKDFAGLAYEDTDGSLFYCANSKLANLRIHVYRRGKLESAFYANRTAAFEVASRRKNPYVPILI